MSGVGDGVGVDVCMDFVEGNGVGVADGGGVDDLGREVGIGEDNLVCVGREVQAVRHRLGTWAIWDWTGCSRISRRGRTNM